MTDDPPPRRQWWDAAVLRGWAVDANDGIIATAGLLEGFAGAGASDHVLIVAAAAATFAGALSLGGTKWAESAGEREAQLIIAADEQARLAADPDEEIAELSAHYRRKGLDADLARRVAEQLSAADPLQAQLETEYGIDEVLTRRKAVVDGVGAGCAFLLGALVPLLITLFVPGRIEFWAILLASVVSLGIVAVIAARVGEVSVRATLIRSLTVGLGTMLVSYGVGLLLF